MCVCGATTKLQTGSCNQWLTQPKTKLDVCLWSDYKASDRVLYSCTTLDSFIHSHLSIYVLHSITWFNISHLIRKSSVSWCMHMLFLWNVIVHWCNSSKLWRMLTAIIPKSMFPFYTLNLSYHHTKHQSDPPLPKPWPELPNLQAVSPSFFMSHNLLKNFPNKK